MQVTFAESLKLIPFIVIEKLEIQFYKNLTRKLRFFVTRVWKIANNTRDNCTQLPSCMTPPGFEPHSSAFQSLSS